MGADATDLRLPGPQNDHPEHYRGETQCVRAAKQNPRALWEYDHILRTLYLLDYVDSPPLRRNVQRALNRGENDHQLRRAVSYANFGKLRFKTEQEQQLWGECARLLTNRMIYYNATRLSQLWERKAHNGDLQGAALLAQVSPVAWQHINVYRRYEFSRGTAAINIQEIIEELDRVPMTPELV